jgi:hypothetical protein
VVGEDCPKAIRVGEVEFENLISLEWPDNPAVRARGQKIPFGLDETSFLLFERTLASSNRASEDVYATFEGLLITRTPPFNLVHPRYPAQRLGFGHLGAAPAEIVVKQVSDIEIVKKTVR